MPPVRGTGTMRGVGLTSPAHSALVSGDGGKLEQQSGGERENCRDRFHGKRMAMTGDDVNQRVNNWKIIFSPGRSAAEFFP